MELPPARVILRPALSAAASVTLALCIVSAINYSRENGRMKVDLAEVKPVWSDDAILQSGGMLQHLNTLWEEENPSEQGSVVRRLLSSGLASTLSGKKWLEIENLEILGLDDEYYPETDTPVPNDDVGGKKKKKKKKTFIKKNKKGGRKEGRAGKRRGGNR